MFGIKSFSFKKEKKENEAKLRKLHGREIKYVTKRDSETYVEMVIGKNGVIDISDDLLTLVCDNKTIYSGSIKELYGSDLMSLDGMILTRSVSDSLDEDKIVVYYKYYRKV